MNNQQRVHWLNLRDVSGLVHEATGPWQTRCQIEEGHALTRTHLLHPTGEGYSCICCWRRVPYAAVFAR